MLTNERIAELQKELALATVSPNYPLRGRTVPIDMDDLRQLLAAAEREQRLRELLESAWGIIANVNRGSWNMIPDGSWINAAEKWRDKYHEATQPAKEDSK